MKKVLVAMVMVMTLLVSSVAVYAADSGLNATYYQKDGIKEGDASTAVLEHLGSTTESTGNFEANKEALFGSLKKMGTIKVDSFEFDTNDEDFREQAEEAGCIMIGDRNEADAPDWFVVEYTGYVVATQAGEYQFSSYYIDNGLVVYIGDEMVFEYWGADQWIDTGAEDAYAEGKKFTLEAGKAYPITAYYYDGWGGEVVNLDTSVNGKMSSSTYSAGLRFYTEEPTAEDIAKQLATPEPTPTPTTKPSPTTAKPAATSSAKATAGATASGNQTDSSDFPVVPVVIVCAVVAVAIIAAVVVTVMKKKKKG